MKNAVTLVAAVLGSLLGIAQTHGWCCWMCDVFGDYWARRRIVRLGPVAQPPTALNRSITRV